jgi:hypothetical protein
VWIELIIVERYRGLPLRRPCNTLECSLRVIVEHRKLIDIPVPMSELTVDDPRLDLSRLLFGENDGGNAP